MSNWDAGSSWEYSRWLKNYARNSRITEPTGTEKAGIITFLKYIWNPVTQTGTRPWLQATFQRKATSAASGNDYDCNLDAESAAVLVELLEIVGRDLKKLPITAGEVAQCGNLFLANPDRVFGTTPRFGNVGGSVVSVP